MIQSLIPVDLHCERRVNPLGIDTPSPRLGWALEGGGRGAAQSAWRIQAGTAPGLGDLWDTGKTPGDTQFEVQYAGQPLRSRLRCHWRVQVWDKSDVQSSWSAPAWFEAAYLDPAEFPGDWIGLRDDGGEGRRAIAIARWIRPLTEPATEMAVCAVKFQIPSGRKAVRAFTHCLAEGHANPWSSGVKQFLSVNGVRLDNAEHLSFCVPMTFDIAHCLKPGDNTVAVRWWRNPDSAFIGVLEVELDDGSTIQLPTGKPGWLARGVPKLQPDPTWDDLSAANWAEPDDVGPFGAGPWPSDDRRNKLDRLLPATLLRRTIQIDKQLSNARVHATACGVYELRMNGAQPDNRVLAPGWTDYRKRIHYQTYDVTAMMRTGRNELSATVGDGWWCGHLATPFGSDFYGTHKALKLALQLDYADGTSETISTDKNWEAATGPIRLADIMEGQVTDLTRPIGLWRPAAPLPSPAGRLQAQPDEPVRRLMELPPRSLTEKRPGVYVIDFGQNLVGWVRLELRAPAGTRVIVRHAEVLDLKGEIWTENLRSALAVDTHFCSGGTDVFEPTLTFHGFRYAEVSGLPGGLRPEQVAAVVIGSDTPDRGTFTCDNPLLNRLQANIRWGQRGNFLSVPTDCPQRDERLGWSCDAQVFARTATFNADCAAFLAKYIDDLVDSQSPDGVFADFAPTNAFNPTARFGWSDAAVFITWILWRVYGDSKTAVKAWPALTRYLDYRARNAKDGLNVEWSFGDWVSPPPQTPFNVLGPVYDAWAHRLMAEMADGLAMPRDAIRHRIRFNDVSSAWRKAHLATDGHCRSSDTQAIYACAIMAGVLSSEEAGPHLTRTIERHGWHLNTGFLGTYCLLPALTLAGRTDVAWRILLQETAPSWLYTVKNGATTMWERWNTYSPETGPVNIGNMNSYNHYAFGAVGEWMYANILGIDRAPGDIAFRELIVQPAPGGCCKHARGEFRSVRGTIRSAWWLDDTGLNLDVSIPPNCSAEVRIPTSHSLSTVLEGKLPACEAPNVVQRGYERGHAVFAVEAGDYHFSATF